MTRVTAILTLLHDLGRRVGTLETLWSDMDRAMRDLPNVRAVTTRMTEHHGAMREQQERLEMMDAKQDAMLIQMSQARDAYLRMETRLNGTVPQAHARLREAADQMTRAKQDLDAQRADTDTVRAYNRLLEAKVRRAEAEAVSPPPPPVKPAPAAAEPATVPATPPGRQSPAGTARNSRARSKRTRTHSRR